MKTKIWLNMKKIYFEFYRKCEQYSAMQIIGFNSFNELNIESMYNNLWIEEGNKILRRKKLYNKIQKMVSSKVENNIAVFWNDIYLNSVVNF
jgi:hypothetical protein